LASKPKLLLLDEPTAGMNPQESAEMMHFIRKLRDEIGITYSDIPHSVVVHHYHKRWLETSLGCIHSSSSCLQTRHLLQLPMLQ
jgi:ABC-type branched-subunit amino acid transport system ATPase component